MEKMRYVLSKCILSDGEFKKRKLPLAFSIVSIPDEIANNGFVYIF